MITKLLNNSFLRSGFVYSAASFLVSVINYLFNLLIARNFSLSAYGEYMTALSYVSIFAVPISAFSMVVIRKLGYVSVAERPGLAHAIQDLIFTEAQKYSYLLIAASLAISLGLYFKGNLNLLTIVFIYTSLFLNLMAGFYTASLQAFKAFLLAGIFVILGSLLKLTSGLFVVFSLPKLSILYLAIVLAGVVNLLVGKKFVFKKKVKKAKVVFKETTFYLKQKQILIPLLTSLGLMVLLNVDLILVKKFFDPDQAGLYASLSLLGKIILYIVMPISSVAFTFFTGSESKDKSNKVLFLASLSFILVAILSVIFYYLFPELIIKIIFGNKFLAVSSLVYLSAMFGGLYALLNLFAQYFVAQNSYLGALTLLAVLVQTSLIYLYHHSLSQVLWINVAVFASLVLIYLLVLIKKLLFSESK